jgi:hypothetical protein
MTTTLGAAMTESNPKADPEMVKQIRAKLEERLIPKLQGKRFRRKTVVAIKVMSIIDHRIGRAEPANPAAWDEVREALKERPEALPQIDAVEEAVEKFAAELESKFAAGSENAEVARVAAAKILGTAIMKKLKYASEHDEEDEDPAAAAPPTDEPKP